MARIGNISEIAMKDQESINTDTSKTRTSIGCFHVDPGNGIST
jgi:hypothetical protein